MVHVLASLALIMLPIYLYTKLSGKWQERVKVAFWSTVWVYPVVYIIYATNPKNYLIIFLVIGVSLALAAISFIRQGGFKTYGNGDDDPSGNNNIRKNFTDIM